MTELFIAVVCGPSASARVSLSTMRSSDQTAEAPRETPRTRTVSQRSPRRAAGSVTGDRVPWRGPGQEPREGPAALGGSLGRGRAGVARHGVHCSRAVDSAHGSADRRKGPLHVVAGGLGRRVVAADGFAYPVYERGEGPGIVVVHESPGLTPEVIELGDELIKGGFTVTMPHLFGSSRAPPRTWEALRVVPPLYVTREFTMFATGRTAPLAGSRALARDLHLRAGGPGVGAMDVRDRWFRARDDG